MQISFSAEALADADEAVRWYRDHGGSHIGEAFSKEIRRIALLAGSQPLLGSPSNHGTHRLHLHRFPYPLIYLMQTDAIRIIAVAH